MNTGPETWPHVARVAWLGGGIVAVNNPGTVKVMVATGLNGLAAGELTLPTFASFFHAVSQLSSQLIGATFIQSQDEVEGLVPPEFRAHSKAKAWRVWEASQKWSQVAAGASRLDLMNLLDVASRVASGLRHCEMRLGQLATCYSQQLRSRALRGELREYVRFQDLNSAPVYMAIHALFWELAVLRDTLAEFAAKYAFNMDDIATMRALVGRLRSSKSRTPWADEFIAMASDGAEGWVDAFTAYRNLFTHAAPMEKVAGVAFTVQYQRKTSFDTQLPVIYYPLPGDAKDLMRRRSKGDLYPTLAALVGATSGRTPDPATELDALDYLATTLSRFGELSVRLVELSPVEPQIVNLTSKDLVGPITVVRR